MTNSDRDTLQIEASTYTPESVASILRSNPSAVLDPSFLRSPNNLGDHASQTVDSYLSLCSRVVFDNYERACPPHQRPEVISVSEGSYNSLRIDILWPTPIFDHVVENVAVKDSEVPECLQ